MQRKVTEVDVAGRRLKLSPLTLGEWKELRDKYKEDEKKTQLFIEACVVSAKKNHPEIEESNLREHFNSLTAGFMTSPDGSMINAILSDQRDAIIRLEAEKQRLEEFREEAKLKKEIEQLKKEIEEIAHASGSQT